MHELVARYVTTEEPVHLLLQSLPTNGSPVLRALVFLHECLEGKRLARDAVRACEEVPSKGTDPDLMILMLSAWAELWCRIGRPTATPALIEHARSLTTEQTPPELTARLLQVEARVAEVTGNKAECERLLREALRLLPIHSPRRRFCVWELALLLARKGEGTDSQSELRELAWQGRDPYKLGRLLLVQFINAMETGRAQPAAQLLSQLRAQPLNPTDLLRVPYQGYVALLGLMQAQRQRQSASAAEASGWPAWVQTLRFLLARNVSEALRLARDDAGRQLHPIFGMGFESYNLLRCELSAGAWEGSARLLKLRQARGNRSFMDDFFLARADRLAGNTRGAAQRFAQVLRAAEYHTARGRVDFELALSCELTQGDIVQLTQAAEKTARRLAATPREAVAPAPGAPAPAPAGSAASAAGPEGADGQQRVTALIRGRSAATGALRETALRFASLDAPVLITGETGSGKEVVARALHLLGPRRDQPFTAINCSSITETLLESELFGHERGAFTGAERASKGLFEATGRGTLFLDEIGDISARLQAALLRVLETGEIRAVGSAATRTIACRIVAATNADLHQRTRAGLFRQDLLFRLERLRIHVPPLRERRDDILALVRHYLDAGRRIGVHATLSPALSEALRHYDWPGNIRELRNVVERMRLMHSDKLQYDIEDLDLKFQAASGTDRSAPTAAPLPDALPAPLAEDPAAPAVEDILAGGRSPMRRLDRLRRLFLNHEKLTRAEIVQILRIAPNTATRYLQALCAERFIRRVEPSASTRSYYFERAGQDTTGMAPADIAAPDVRGGTAQGAQVGGSEPPRPPATPEDGS